MTPERIAVVIVGGTAGANGGVEQFARRLSALVTRMGNGPAFSLPANTAVRNGPGSLWRRVARAMATFVANLRAIRTLGRTADRVVVLLQYGNAFDLAYVLARLLPGKCDVHVVAHCSTTWAHLRHRFVRPLVGGLLRRSTAFAVLSDEQRALFAGLGVERMLRLPTLLGLPSTVFGTRPFHDRPRRTMVFGGRVSAEKGVADAIDLVGRLSLEGGEPWRLDIYGTADPAYLPELERACGRARDSGADVRLHGHVAFERLLAALENARFQAYLSVQDAYPLAVLEAIAAGACPVVYALPGTLEIVDRWGGIAARRGCLADLARQVAAVDESNSVAIAHSAVIEHFAEPALVAAWQAFLQRDSRPATGAA